LCVIAVNVYKQEPPNFLQQSDIGRYEARKITIFHEQDAIDNQSETQSETHSDNATSELVDLQENTNGSSSPDIALLNNLAAEK